MCVEGATVMCVFLATVCPENENSEKFSRAGGLFPLRYYMDSPNRTPILSHK